MGEDAGDKAFACKRVVQITFLSNRPVRIVGQNGGSEQAMGGVEEDSCRGIQGRVSQAAAG